MASILQAEYTRRRVQRISPWVSLGLLVVAVFVSRMRLQPSSPIHRLRNGIAFHALESLRAELTELLPPHLTMAKAFPDVSINVERLVQDATDSTAMFGTNALFVSEDGGQYTTGAWATCSYVRELLSPLMPALRRVRMSTIQPGEFIGFHRDSDISFQHDDDSNYIHHRYRGQSTFRVHIPVTSNAGAGTFIGNRLFSFAVGDIWGGDFSLPHFAYNSGNTTRMTLLVDVNMAERETLLQSSLGQVLLAGHDAMCAEVAGGRPTYFAKAARVLERRGEIPSSGTDVASLIHLKQWHLHWSQL